MAVFWPQLPIIRPLPIYLWSIIQLEQEEKKLEQSRIHSNERSISPQYRSHLRPPASDFTLFFLFSSSSFWGGKEKEKRKLIFLKRDTDTRALKDHDTNRVWTQKDTVIWAGKKSVKTKKHECKSVSVSSFSCFWAWKEKKRSKEMLQWAALVGRNCAFWRDTERQKNKQWKIMKHYE